jgi:uncharacterized membrane-anchored protein
MFAVWLKALGIFFLACIFAIMAASLADNGGYLLVRWLGWEIETTMAAFLSFLGVLFLLYLIFRPFFRLFSGLFGR